MSKREDAAWLTLDEAVAEYRVKMPTWRHWIKIGALNATNGLHHLGAILRLNRAEFEARFVDSRAMPRRTSKARGSAK